MLRRPVHAISSARRLTSLTPRAGRSRQDGFPPAVEHREQSFEHPRAVVCMHSAAAVSSAGTISSRLRSRAATPIAAAANEPTRRVPRVRWDRGLELSDRDGLIDPTLRQLPVGPRAPRSRRLQRRVRSARPDLHAHSLVRRVAVVVDAAVDRPSGGLAAELGRDQSLRPVGLVAGCRAQCGKNKGAHSAHGFSTPAAWMVKAAGSLDGSILPPLCPPTGRVSGGCCRGGPRVVGSHCSGQRCRSSRRFGARHGPTRPRRRMGAWEPDGPVSTDPACPQNSFRSRRQNTRDGTRASPARQFIDASAPPSRHRRARTVPTAPSARGACRTGRTWRSSARRCSPRRGPAPSLRPRAARSSARLPTS